MKTYFLQVKDTIRETEDTVTIEFWHPISEQIKYKAGQFITVMVPADMGKKVRRSYSMSSSPYTDTAVAITVKRVEGGLVSNYLCDRVKKGDFLEVIEPMGRFVFEPDQSKERHIVLIGAGSGITPLISIAKTVLKGEPLSKVSLIYGNREKEHIIFWRMLMEMELADRERFRVVHVLSKAKDSWAGPRGRINTANIIVLLKDLDVHFRSEDEEFFLCGPDGMMDQVQKALSVFDVPKERIHVENFHAPMLDESEEVLESLEARDVKLIYEGETYELRVEPHQTILEAALEKDIDLPYSCQAGMCTACLGKCTSGKIRMDEEDGLTEAEREEGFVLTCVSHPETDNVVLEIE
ncbi:ferredoxin--NADP reductase [Marinilongibacter aquaticus]|uniref:ferredoxin--NADP reductase n=1 Tax=Marinilongibacter aquaticus TaxID=2975157 RepID=UPI0021BD7178|nr:ferredoxin--NADP reductase [Marinilongibacter aquaticus]UBM57387.1 ferredoxin--NADP reductase [Marinilongibacter aquaticus]